MTPIKLKIELKDVPHKVIRKVLVPNDINMHQLHLVIQFAMGWENVHLFEFTDKKGLGRFRAGVANEMDDYYTEGDEFGLRNAFDVSLEEVYLERNDKKPFWYWYDFGDDWFHRVSFLKPNKNDLKSYEGQPTCGEAIGKCPPEDVGGIWGYEELLEVIEDKKHPEREEMMEWHGLNPNKKYDEMETNLEMINKSLSSVFKSKAWKKKKYDIF